MTINVAFSCSVSREQHHIKKNIKTNEQTERNVSERLDHIVNTLVTNKVRSSTLQNDTIYTVDNNDKKAVIVQLLASIAEYEKTVGELTRAYISIIQEAHGPDKRLDGVSWGEIQYHLNDQKREYQKAHSDQYIQNQRMLAKLFYGDEDSSVKKDKKANQ